MSVSVSMVRLLDETRTECSGATDGTMRRVLFNILREFFRRSNIWLFELPVYIVPTTNDYVINTCQNANIIRLMMVAKPTYPIADPPIYVPGCPPQFLQFQQQPSYETQNPYPRIPMDGGLLNAGIKCPILRIVWNPGYASTWIAVLSLSVADPVDSQGMPTDIPDWIIEKYYDYIAHGLTARLMLQINKPYSNSKMAEYHMRKFHEGVGLARTESRHSFVFAGQKWVYPQTFATPLHHKAV